MVKYCRVKGYTQILFYVGVSVTINGDTFVHLRASRKRTSLRSFIWRPQRKYKKDTNLYGGWCKASDIVKYYHKLPRKTKKYFKY